MRFFSYQENGHRGIAVAGKDGRLHGCQTNSRDWPGSLDELVLQGGAQLRDAGRSLLKQPEISPPPGAFLPPLRHPGKILCVGLNYVDHAAESGFKVPAYPTVFARFSSSLVGDNQPLVRPLASTQLDYEGELAVIIGRRGRHITPARALDHVLGYSVFNDGSVRDFQHRTGQWTVGKNFDGTGAFGPSLVTADELPPGGAGLALHTRLNGAVMQSASTDDMVFSVASLISILSEAMTLEPGDVIVSGTPAGVGAARTPPVFMKAGDVCEVEIEGVGTLRNRVVDEA